MTLTTTLKLSSPIARTPRVIQLESLFDIAPAQRSEHKLEVKLDLPDDWSIGLIVGPSGCGKTRTGIPLQTWQAWEAGRRQPSPLALAEIKRRLGVR